MRRSSAVTYGIRHMRFCRRARAHEQTRTGRSHRHCCAGLSLAPTEGRCRLPIRVGAGRLYRYYVSQAVLKTGKGDPAAVHRVSAAEVEAAVVGQVRTLLCQPEIIVGTWIAARVDMPELTEGETREALLRLDPLWNELFPAEQARIIRLLVERIEIGPGGADIRLRVEGLVSLVQDLDFKLPRSQEAAA